MPLLDAAGLGPLAEATTDGGEVSVGSGFSICLRVTVVCKYVPESDRTQARRRPAQYATAKWDREVIIGVDTFHDHGATIVGYCRIRADAVRATLAHSGEGGVFINHLARDAHVAHTHRVPTSARFITREQGESDSAYLHRVRQLAGADSSASCGLAWRAGAPWPALN